jgi:chaperonin cofactor prefoldin
VDDDNKLFKNGKVYGRIKINGDVELYNVPKKYEIELEKSNEKLESKNEIKNSNEKMKSKTENEMQNIIDQMLADATNSDWIKEIMNI